MQRAVQKGFTQGNAAYQCPPWHTCCEQPSEPGWHETEQTDPAANTCRCRTQEPGGSFLTLCVTLAEAPVTPATTASAAANETIFKTELVRMLIPILNTTAYLAPAAAFAKAAFAHTV